VKADATTSPETPARMGGDDSKHKHANEIGCKTSPAGSHGSTAEPHAAEQEP